MMPHLHQGLARHHHPSSSGPICHSTNSNVRAADFEFWGEQTTKDHKRLISSRHVELEFHPEIHDEQDYGAYSPSFSTSPLLPCNYLLSCPSPKSRLKSIVDGKKELMEMIKDMPESSYELSLKDIVDKQNAQQAEKIGVIDEDSGPNQKPIVKTRQKGKIGERGKMSRCESMDSGVFLLRIFFPISLLSLKRKSTAANGSKIVSPRPSLEVSEKAVDREWWQMRFLAMRRAKNTGRSSSTGSSSTSKSGSSRHDDVKFTPSCWSFRK